MKTLWNFLNMTVTIREMKFMMQKINHIKLNNKTYNHDN
jgi:hypothetical protein